MLLMMMMTMMMKSGLVLTIASVTVISLIYGA